ncbi:hypothetical protein EA806_15980, partial [Listeria monocytogenes]|nr:hypothetical protein [Listeria monocytogenes]
ILCNIVTNAAIAKTHSIYCWHWLLVKVYKTTHKQCTNRKGANVDVTAFAPFWCVTKLLFGNVILNDFAYFINL